MGECLRFELRSRDVPFRNVSVRLAEVGAERLLAGGEAIAALLFSPSDSAKSCLMPELAHRSLVRRLHLQAQGVRITTGTIVDATILHAPTSTKNREQQRDPEMHQTKKGKQWYFGMKAHVGVDSKTKIIHTAVATAANVDNSAALPEP